MANNYPNAIDISSGLNFQSEDGVSIEYTYEPSDVSVVDNSGFGGTMNTPSYGGIASSAISSAAVIAGTVMKTQAYLADMEAKTEQITTAMDGVVNEHIAMMNISSQQMKAVDRTVGDQLSRSGLERMKSEARLVAGAAMTGTSGGTTKMATTEARMIEMLDNSVIIARGRAEKTNIMNKEEMSSISAQNRLKYMATGIPSDSSAMLGAINAGISGAYSGYRMLPESQRERYFSYNS